MELLRRSLKVVALWQSQLAGLTKWLTLDKTTLQAQWTKSFTTLVIDHLTVESCPYVAAWALRGRSSECYNKIRSSNNPDVLMIIVLLQSLNLIWAFPTYHFANFQLNQTSNNKQSVFLKGELAFVNIFFLSQIFGKYIQKIHVEQHQIEMILFLMPKYIFFISFT